jgi:UDP-N-acetylmuramate dehydrogenase
MIEKKFQNLRGALRLNYNLAHLTWLKAGGNAEIFYKAQDLSDLQNFFQQIPEYLDVNIIGAGSNLLIRDGGIDGITLKLGAGFNYINQDKDLITVGAATLNYNLSQFALQNLLQGFEFLSGIPGSIGGGIAMNAGAYGREFKDILHSVKALTKNGEEIELMNDEIGFGYRLNPLREKLIFVEAKFKFEYVESHKIAELMEKIKTQRKATQPINEKTAGSTFANVADQKVWQLMDKVGMRGYTLNGAQISNMHPNFLINLGNAKSCDLEEVAEIARAKVLKETGFELRWEVIRLGKK